MWYIALYIFLGLPNGTECTQQMDQGYQLFKPDMDRSAIRVASIKMARRVDYCKKAKLNKAAVASLTHQAASDPSSSDKSPLNTNLVEEDPMKDLEEYLEGDAGNVSDDKDDKLEFMLNKSVCAIHLTNCDLASIVNGYPKDPIELRPFD